MFNYEKNQKQNQGGVMTKKYYEVMYKKAGKQIYKAYQFTDDVKAEDKLGSFVSSYWNNKFSNLKITNLTDNIHYDYDKIETLKQKKTNQEGA